MRADAEELFDEYGGGEAYAVASFRTGDPSSGDYDEAVIIARYGEELSLDELMSAD